MALCEAAAYYKTKGKTLWDAMLDMYEKYGYYKDSIQSITLKGIEGLQKIQEIMDTLRKNPPKEVAGYQVLKTRDYQADEILNVETGEKTGTGLPKSNVLYYDLSDDAWLCVRPSGTEPKVKFYYGVKGTSVADSDEKSEKMGKDVLAMIDQEKFWKLADSYYCSNKAWIPAKNVEKLKTVVMQTEEKSRFLEQLFSFSL